jgi:hypothetical protein
LYLEQTLLAVAIPYVDMTISTTSGECPIAAKVLYNSGIVIEATRESQVFIDIARRTLPLLTTEHFYVFRTCDDSSEDDISAS